MTIAIIAITILYPCQGGMECIFVEKAKVTEYVPEWGGINCQEPCDMTAFMVPVQYGVTAACGPDIPYNTIVTFVTPWGEVVTRRCQDRGGGVGNEHIDVAMPPDDNGYYYSMSQGGWPALWCWPVQEEDTDEVEIARMSLVSDIYVY
jgi:hypothetical protein